MNWYLNLKNISLLNMGMFTMNMLNAIEIMGTIAFAISGSMVAIRKRVDLFGVLLLGMTTAVGGGIVRDVLLGNTPPRIFSSMTILLIAFTSSLIVFLVAYFAHEKYQRNHLQVDRINNVFDAFGLGLFTVTGMKVAEECGIEHVVILIFFGAVTGIGGGLIRDLMVNEIPFVLKKHIYAVASIAGGLSYFMLKECAVKDTVAVGISILIVVVLRILATVFRWNLPRV